MSNRQSMSGQPEAPMTETQKLRPCPFCGSEPDDCPQNSERPHPTRKSDWCVYIWCDNCDARGPEKREAVDAIAAWNTRPSPSESMMREALQQIAEWGDAAMGFESCARDMRETARAALKLEATDKEVG